MAHTVWELQGTVAQTLYSPRGGIEGFLLDVDGVTVQFVCEEDDPACAALEAGQRLVAQGTVRPDGGKGPSAHEVYDLVALPGTKPAPSRVAGRIVRFNHAKHGAPNGVVLDSGHFIHTKPDGLQRLGWKLGQRVEVSGHALRPLADRRGFVVEFRG